ncbi:unnamed protein product, partial [Scytosiphon promiscuus]
PAPPPAPSPRSSSPQRHNSQPCNTGTSNYGSKETGDLNHSAGNRGRARSPSAQHHDSSSSQHNGRRDTSALPGTIGTAVTGRDTPSPQPRGRSARRRSPSSGDSHGSPPRSDGSSSRSR